VSVRACARALHVTHLLSRLYTPMSHMCCFCGLACCIYILALLLIAHASREVCVMQVALNSTDDSGCDDECSHDAKSESLSSVVCIKFSMCN
jgi:hypothetical protein